MFEKLEVKAELFAELDRDLPATAPILATNTSAIPITSIAAATSRPERGRGHALLLAGADDAAVRARARLQDVATRRSPRAREFAEGVGKTCVVVNRDVAGFVTTRLISALAVEAVALLENGVASAEDIDTACRLGFGHAMGPLETDRPDRRRHHAATPRRNIYADTQDEKFAAPELLRRMVAAGDLGRKTGRGFYSHG